MVILPALEIYFLIICFTTQGQISFDLSILLAITHSCQTTQILSVKPTVLLQMDLIRCFLTSLCVWFSAAKMQVWQNNVAFSRIALYFLECYNDIDIFTIILYLIIWNRCLKHITELISRKRTSYNLSVHHTMLTTRL